VDTVTSGEVLYNAVSCVAIVLYLRLFSNMGDKTHPFTISLCNTFVKIVTFLRVCSSVVLSLFDDGISQLLHFILTCEVTD